MKNRAARKYFAYVGKHFPVMCASGAFQLMPPVTEAGQWLDRFDDLSRRGIGKHVERLARFKNDFTTAEAKAATHDEKGVFRALAESASCAIAELDLIRTWEKAPELYLNVAFTGLDQAVDLPAANTRAREKRFLKRLKKIPTLLNLAPKNIEAISPTSRGLSLTMVRDCARFLTELGQSDLGKTGKAPRYLANCLAALRDFDRFIASRPEVAEPDGPSFAVMSENVFNTSRTAEDIFAIAERKYQESLEALKALEPEIGGSWQEALDAYEGPGEAADMEAVDVIVREIHRLRGFVFESALPSVFNDSGLRIEAQPLHLASTLRPIHYDPALGAWADEPSRCYVSPQLFSGRGFRDDPMKLARMRREYLFVAARQTYPGRHLLDSQRRSLGDSPLSQITNPLFMSGWLAFAEELLDELGYLVSPLDRLVSHQRRLSRAALAMIDAGLAVGNLDQDTCLSILSGAGYSRDEALNHVRAIRMAPTSRVQPILGLHELHTLYRSSGLSLPGFCKRLFANGQLPLSHLAEAMSK